MPIEYTLLFSASNYTKNKLCDLFVNAFTKSHTTIDSLCKVYDENLRVLGRKHFGSALDLYKREYIGLKSMLEKRFWDLVIKHVFPKPEMQYLIKCYGRTYRIDFAYPDFKLCIEIDGWAYHSRKAQFTKDRER